MTNPEALKELYKAYGGDEADVADMSRSSDIILAIAEKVAEEHEQE